MKALRTAALVVGAVALIVTTAGAAIPGVAAAVTGFTGLSMAAIGAIGTLATTFAQLTAKKPKPTIGGSATDFKADPNAGIPYMMGRTAHAGNIVDRDTWGQDNIYQGFAIVYGGGGPYDGFEKLLVDGADANIVGDTAQGFYSGWMWHRSAIGTCPNPPIGTPLDGWGRWSVNNGARLSGIAHGIWVLKFDKKDGKKFASGVPQPLAVWRGAKVYDPRQDSTYPGGSGPCRPLQEATYVYSENPYCHAVTWALGRWQNGKRVLGVGLPFANIDWPTAVSCMNVADANGWKIGGTIYSVDDKWNALKAMCQAGGGEPIRSGAMLSFSVNAPLPSVMTITDADISGACKIVATQSRRDRKNTVIPKARSEAHNWQVVPFDPIANPTYLAEDGAPRTFEHEMPLVQNQGNQVAQLAAYEVASRREFGPINLTTKTRCIGVKPGDQVTLNISELALVNQPAIVTNRTLDPETGDVMLVLKSETPAKHAFCLGRTPNAPPTPALGVNQDLSNPRAPGAGAWSVAATTLASPQGGTTPAIVVLGAVDNPNAESVSFWTRPPGGSEASWTAAGAGLSIDTTRQIIAPVTPRATYEVGVSYTAFGFPSAKTVLGQVTVGDIVAASFVGAGPFATATDIGFGSGYSIDLLRPAELGAQVTTGRQAGSVVGQGRFATRDFVSYGDPDLRGMGTFAGLSKLAFGDGFDIDNLRPAELGAQVTTGRQAGSIVGQGSFATRNAVDRTDTALLTGFGSFAGLSNIGFGSGYSIDLLRPAEVGAQVTTGRQAGSIVGQGRFATRDTIDRTSADLTGFGTFAGLSNIGFGSGYAIDTLRPAEVGAQVTTGRQAGSIVGQGLFATDTRNPAALFTPGGNLIYNGGFRLAQAVTGRPVGWLLYYDPAFYRANDNANGWFMGVAGPRPAETRVLFSDPFDLVAGVSYTLQCEMFSLGLASGGWAIDVAYYGDAEALNVFQGTIGTISMNSQAGWTPRAQEFVAPSGAAKFRLRIFQSNASVVAGQSLAIRKVKLSATNGGYTAWSDEATDGANAGRLAGRLVDPQVINTQLLVGPRNTGGLDPTYTVQSGGVLVTLPAHTRTIAGANGPVSLYYGGGSGFVAFNTYWVAYVDDPNQGGFVSPTFAFDTNPANLLYPGRYHVASGVSPASNGTGGTTGGGGGGGTISNCVAADSWVMIDPATVTIVRPDITWLAGQPWVRAHAVRPGDRIRALMADNTAGWETVTANRPAAALGVRLDAGGGHVVDCSATTPVTLADGSCVAAIDANGREAAVEVNGAIEWRPLTVTLAGLLEVARISCNDGTYLAGTTPGRGVFTHNVVAKP